MSTQIRSFRKLSFVQFKLFVREPLAFFFTAVFPVTLLLLFGAIWGNAPGSAGPGSPYGYVDSEVPALTGLIIATIALMSIPIATAAAREHRLLRRYRATPLSPAIYLAADVAVYYAIALLGMIMLIVIGKIVFDMQMAGSWLSIFLAFTLSALAFIAGGYLIASLAPSERSAMVIGQLIFFPMMFLSGAAMPLFILPENIRKVSEWLPLTHVVRLLQSLWFGQGWDMTAVGVLLALLVIGTMLSIRFFRWE
jgi:ABC-2 type transport system permease protein